MAKGYGNYFPSFLPKESAIWAAFLEAHPEIPREIDYNMRVGVGFAADGAWDPSARRAAILNSQLRLDAVVHWDGAWWIFEVKVRCGAGAVGQIQQYEILYEEAEPTHRPIKLAIVTDLPRLGLATLCRRVGITLYIQPAVFPAPGL
jgi:hypothetical protein